MLGLQEKNRHLVRLLADAGSVGRAELGLVAQAMPQILKPSVGVKQRGRVLCHAPSA